MFGADRGEPSENLAARLSMTADGYTDNSAFDEFCHEADGSFQASSETAPELQGAIGALGNFDEGLTVFDAVAQSFRFDDSMLDPLDEAVKSVAGTPWPTPYKAPDYVSATTEFIPSKDLNPLEGFRGAGADDDLDRMIASFEGVGLAAAPAQSARARDFKTVVVAAALAGTQTAGKTAQALLRKSIQVAALADDRAKAAAQARAGFARDLREVDALDARAKLLMKQILDEQGRPRPGTTLMDIERLKKLRARATSLGRRAVRYQKVNALATPLAQNAIAQADILQKTSAMVLAGNAGAAAALGKMYDDLGRKSAEIRAVREKQLLKWRKKPELEGLEGFASLGDPYEAQLNAIERADVMAFAGLEWSIRGAVKGAVRGVKRAAKSVVKTTKSAVKSTIIAPTKATIAVVKKTAKGDIRGAFREVGGAVRGAAQNIADVAGKVFLDYPCRLASSTVGKAAVQMAGQAVGTIYGGPAGGALGKEAGRQAGQTNQSICGGLRKIGITKGAFRPGQVKGAFSKVAKDLYKTSLSPQAAFLAAKNVASSIGPGMIMGGMSIPGGGDLLSKLGTDTLQKLGAGNVQNLVTRKIGQLATQQGQRLVAQNVQRVLPSAVRSVTASPVFQTAATEYVPAGFLKDYL